MQQVLFTIPFINIAVSGYGGMLFLAFILCTLWAMRRGKPVGLPSKNTQDMVILLFLAGLCGARLLYMYQYSDQFPDKRPIALILAFFQIWKGGIIFYGSALGGVIGYGLFYWYVVRRLNVSGWKLADAMAPILALGLAIGRFGCYLNGCCWGQVAVEEVAPVPLGGAHFPLLPAPAREQLVHEFGLQSSTGFTLTPRDRFGAFADPRSVVAAVERGSPADRAGLKPGDRILQVNGQPNAIEVDVLGDPHQTARVLDELRKQPGAKDSSTPDRAVAFDNPADFARATKLIDRPEIGVSLIPTDSLSRRVRDWPRSDKELQLTVQRGGQDVDLPAFIPRTIGVYPTQLYEIISALLLIPLLLAYYPYRHHDGELMVVCMIGYAIHRFINESIRIEPIFGFALTISQWGSVIIFAAAVGIEIYLWRVMPSLWARPPVHSSISPLPGTAASPA